MKKLLKSSSEFFIFRVMFFPCSIVVSKPILLRRKKELSTCVRFHPFTSTHKKKRQRNDEHNSEIKIFSETSSAATNGQSDTILRPIPGLIIAQCFMMQKILKRPSRWFKRRREKERKNNIKFHCQCQGA